MTGKVPARNSLSPIGLDIGPTEIRAAQLAGNADRHDVARWLVAPRPSAGRADGPTPEDGVQIAELLRRNGFSGRRVVIAARSGLCTPHVVALPNRESGAPIDPIARAEIARTTRRDPGSFELAAWYLPARGRGEQGLAIACERAALESELDALEAGGLMIGAVDIEEAALCRAYEQRIASEPDAIHAVLRTGWESSLGVLTVGRTIVYTRRVGFGVSSIVERFSANAGISRDDAVRIIDRQSAGGAGGVDAFTPLLDAGWAQLAGRLAGELDTAVTYVAHSYRDAPIGRVLVSGYGADRADVRAAIEERLEMAGDEASPGRDDGVPFGRLALAVGLAGRFAA